MSQGLRCRLLGALLGSALFLGFLASPGLRIGAGLIAAGTNPPQSSRWLFYNLRGNPAGAPVGLPLAVSNAPSGNQSLLVLGSSELGADVTQNPGSFLPEHASDFDLFLSGRGYTQSLFQAINLSATASGSKLDKVVLVLSPQWFTPEGSLPEAFQTVFSAEGYFRMLNDPKLPPDLKERIRNRADTLRGVSTGGNVLQNNAATLWVEGRAETAKLGVEAGPWRLPYGSGGDAKPVKDVDWDTLIEEARAEGQELATNEYHIRDDYYRDYLGPAVEETKGKMAQTDYAQESPEYHDLELFLEVARSHGIEVMLVNVPMHGKWYDLAEYPADRRAQYYQRIRDLAAKWDVQLADLSEYEYEPHFFVDTQHLGWVGWVRVIRACVDFARA
ncbi:D-alanyl-lipoteichoic acid biosynthesis protein DltD [Arachnia propionica]|uniref:D-alanyl-lipoteichoic acid biosynthesis protein DltD n=1 Tax=Arachnia propionica TaxID=1750 RepID=A0A3P1WM50_9ACTN|nr:D-alanyl-lipoteichoic acid biosynthesis protein DltD [Arachnia propionica]RRD47235.1 hypothetical protein EII35_15155 [Arachnia propionica]